jgi:hypothetical protein
MPGFLTARWKRRRRSILVFGYCQASHLGRLLKAIPYVTERFEVCVIEIFPDPLTGEYAAPAPEILESCEYAYFQLGQGDAPPGYLKPLIAKRKALRFPVLICQALWPAHVELHRKLRIDQASLQEPGLPWGRFPCCDRVLLDLVDSGPDDERTVEEYLRMDLAETLDLDRKVEIWRDYIQQLDDSCDVPMAELQWREWRTFQHFWTVSHPTNRLVGGILRGLLKRTVRRTPEEEVARALGENELNQFMTPIHPSVARRLDLQWYSPDALYIWPDGPFTIRQWALEHLRYTRRVLAEVRSKKLEVRS